MKKVKIGVIGAGGIARRRTIPGMLLANNIELTAVMDIFKIDEIAAEFGVKKAYSKVEDILADPDVEAVYIATPASMHRQQIELAAAAGKHVLCEKPLTMTLEDAEAAVAACKKAGVFLQEGYMMPFHGAHQAIRKAIDEGKIGKIVYMRAQLSCWYPPIPGAWRQDPAKGGGGSLIDMATHLYDLLEYFNGPIAKVVSFTGNLVHDYKSEDSSTTMLQFANGAQATVDAFFCVPDESTKTRLEIYGSKGAIFTEGTIGQSKAGSAEIICGLGVAGYDAQQSKDVARVFTPLEFPKINPYTAECEYFANCIINGTAPTLNTGENALRIMDITAKAYASAIDGQVKNV